MKVWKVYNINDNIGNNNFQIKFWPENLTWSHNLGVLKCGTQCVALKKTFFKI